MYASWCQVLWLHSSFDDPLEIHTKGDHFSHSGQGGDSLELQRFEFLSITSFAPYFSDFKFIFS